MVRCFWMAMVFVMLTAAPAAACCEGWWTNVRAAGKRWVGASITLNVSDYKALIPHFRSAVSGDGSWAVALGALGVTVAQNADPLATVELGAAAVCIQLPQDE